MIKNLLLIGDSIRMGYDKSVRKILEGKANVVFSDDNCRYVTYILHRTRLYQDKKLCPNAYVIFATSARVLTEKMNKGFKRFNDEIAKYNEAAVEIVKNTDLK